MAALPSGKKTLNIFSGTVRQIWPKHGMKHRRLNPITFCSNDKPGLTLTYYNYHKNYKILTLAMKNYLSKQDPQHFTSQGLGHLLLKLLKLHMIYLQHT